MKTLIEFNKIITWNLDEIICDINSLSAKEIPPKILKATKLFNKYCCS